MFDDVPYQEDGTSKKRERDPFARMLLHEFLAPNMLKSHTLGDKKGYQQTAAPLLIHSSFFYQSLLMFMSNDVH